MARRPTDGMESESLLRQNTQRRLRSLESNPRVLTRPVVTAETEDSFSFNDFTFTNVLSTSVERPDGFTTATIQAQAITKSLGPAGETGDRVLFARILIDSDVGPTGDGREVASVGSQRIHSFPTMHARTFQTSTDFDIEVEARFDGAGFASNRTVTVQLAALTLWTP